MIQTIGVLWVLSFLKRFQKCIVWTNFSLGCVSIFYWRQGICLDNEKVVKQCEHWNYSAIRFVQLSWAQWASESGARIWVLYSHFLEAVSMKTAKIPVTPIAIENEIFSIGGWLSAKKCRISQPGSKSQKTSELEVQWARRAVSQKSSQQKSTGKRVSQWKTWEIAEI